jgi:hypothetical protein
LESAPWCLHYWLARYCADHHVPVESAALEPLFTLQLGPRDPGLPPDLTPIRWQAFVDDYFRFVDYAYRDIRSEAERERRRLAILRKYDLALPEDIEGDDHSTYCRLCIAGIFQYAYRFDRSSD